MSADAQTMAAYAREIDAYADFKEETGSHPILLEFASRVPAGGLVLDLGCGSGAEAARMVGLGLKVDAVDASPEMVALASRVNGVAARVGTFAELEAVERYDGVWAHFSLLHAPRSDLPTHLSAVIRSMRPGAVFHICMKLGDGESRDSLGRLYTYVEEDELQSLLRAAGFVAGDPQIGLGRGLEGELDPWIAHLCEKPT